MSLYLATGNWKLNGKGRMVRMVRKGRKTKCGVFSIPGRGATCPGATPECLSHCYAGKAWRQYENTRKARTRNLRETRRKDFVQRMANELRAMGARTPLRWFRIHEDGDFYSQAYLDKWFRVCSLFPKTRFLAFTKSFHLDFSKQPDNLTVVWSIWSDTDMSTVPDGPRAYAGDSVPEGEDVFPCAGTCMDCLFCWNAPKLGKNVQFEEIH